MMTRLMVMAAMTIGAGLLAPLAPATAQERTLIIYGNDKCPAGTICVRAPEADRYRIPQSLRSGTLPPANQPWAQRASSASRAGSAVGIGSCSPVGAGGSIGCTQKMLREAREEARQDNAARSASPEPR